MKLDKKLYRVTFGYATKKEDNGGNWRSVNIVAENAPDAIKRVRSGKNEYIAEVEIIAAVDVE